MRYRDPDDPEAEAQRIYFLVTLIALAASLIAVAFVR